jgi:peptide/nickel transport system substrate-binding protein
MFSVVPAENRFWYATDLPRYGDGMSRESRIKTAYRLLVDAGYSWRVPPVDAAGNIQPASEIRHARGDSLEVGLRS